MRVTHDPNSNTLRFMPALRTQSPGEPKRVTQITGKASASVRVALVFYSLLVVYASCYPFSGWHDNGLMPWSYLTEHFPHYWTGFDLTVNVVGYIPLGMLTVLALYPWLRSLPAILVASVSGFLLALILESVQSFLPSRVPSNLDLLTNTIGMSIGALFGELLRAPILEQSQLRALRRLWFSEQASRGLIVTALWPLAQIFPQPYLFGHGQVLSTFSAWLSDLLESPVDLGLWLWSQGGAGIEQYLPAEVIITACGMTGAILTLLCQTRQTAPKIVLAFFLMASALTVKTLAHAILFDPDDAFGWFTPSAASGLLMGLVMLGGLSFAPAIAQRRAAIFSLCVSLFLINIAPANPYFLATLQEWVQGKFLNFNGAAHFLSLTWPLFALWFLTHKTHGQSEHT